MPEPEREEPRGPRPLDAALREQDPLARGRLVLALDALLTTRSVTTAAAQLGLQPSGMSRILGELRRRLDDPLLIRSGRGLIPSPRADELRPQISSLAAQIHAVFDGAATTHNAEPRLDESFNRPHPNPVAPLAVTPAPLDATPARRGRRPQSEGKTEHSPSPQTGPGSTEAPSPQQRLANAICVLGPKRKKQGGILDPAEAEDAMDVILSGAADPVQIGAFLGILHLRGLTAGELAAFVTAAQRHIRTAFDTGRGYGVDLDWPCYVSPNTVRPPWFFHAARLVAQAGYRVVLHGNCGSGAVSGRNGLLAKALDVPVCASAAETKAAILAHNIAYVPLPELSPQIFRLLSLHRLTGSRSPVFDLVHLLCPVPAKASLLGVSKPSYREIHRDAAALLRRPKLGVIENTRDVAELNPYRATTILRLDDGAPSDIFVARIPEPKGPGRLPLTSMEHWRGVWTGEASDPRAEQVIIHTAAAALLTLEGGASSPFEAYRAHALELWRSRHSPGAWPRQAAKGAIGTNCVAAATVCRSV